MCKFLIQSHVNEFIYWTNPMPIIGGLNKFIYFSVKWISVNFTQMVHEIPSELDTSPTSTYIGGSVKSNA